MGKADSYKAQSISIITLGVEDVDRSVKFYEALGWELSPDSDPGMCTFMVTSNIAIGLVPYDFLANDALLPVSPKQEYHGFTLALNGASPEEVDALFNRAVEAGGKATRYLSGRTGGDMRGIQGIFWILTGIPGKWHMLPF